MEEEISLLEQYNDVLSQWEGETGETEMYNKWSTLLLKENEINF